jgi:hypothetical protein
MLSGRVITVAWLCLDVSKQLGLMLPHLLRLMLTLF